MQFRSFFFDLPVIVFSLWDPAIAGQRGVHYWITYFIHLIPPGLTSVS